ncbi:MAG TPA: SDR family oxidoreductase [Chitinophagaceae bacterium]|jgi:uncharacterized protein YbjT (DUF2867 family)
MKHVLVAGATGYLGGHITNELKTQKYFVRAVTRNRNKLLNLHPGIDEIIEAEITKPQTLDGCCEGIDAVITTIGITRQKDKLTYMDVDYQGNLNLLTEAKKSGVKRFIYIFIFNTEKIKRLKIVQAKKKFTDALKTSSLNYCLINPTGFFSDMGEFLKMASKGTVYLFGEGKYSINPIDGNDLAKVCVDAIETTEHEINIGGPQVFTHEQIASMAFHVLNKPVKIRYIPLWLKDFILFLLRKFTHEYTYGPVEFLMTVLTMDMVAPKYGYHTLEKYFEELSDE